MACAGVEFEVATASTGDEGYFAPAQVPPRRCSGCRVKLPVLVVAALAAVALGGEWLAGRSRVSETISAHSVDGVMVAAGVDPAAGAAPGSDAATAMLPVASATQAANDTQSASSVVIAEGTSTLDLMINQIEKQIEALSSEIKEKADMGDLLDNFEGMSALSDQIRDLSHFRDDNKRLRDKVVEFKRKLDAGKYEDAVGALAEVMALKCLASNKFKIAAIQEEMQSRTHEQDYQQARACAQQLKALTKSCEDPKTAPDPEAAPPSVLAP